MAWPTPPRSSHPAVLGFRAQTLSMGGAFGPQLALLGATPGWLLALARARALAASAPEAHLALSTMLAELALVTGHAPPRWSPHFDRPTPAPAPAHAPELDPGQLLLLDPGSRACPHTRALAHVLAAQAFGSRSTGGLSRTARIRSAAPVVPEPARAHWLAGLELRLPRGAEPLPQVQALHLVERAFPHHDAVAATELDPALPLELALDAVLVALTLRLTLRLSGTLSPASAPHGASAASPSGQATVVTAPPAGAPHAPTGS